MISTGDTTTDTIAQFEGSSKAEYNKKICHEIKKQKNNKMPLISIYLSLQTKKRRCENITILEWKTTSMYSEVVPGYESKNILENFILFFYRSPEHFSIKKL